ncbi:response regulator [bacterium]|nr:response regulator [bacterium]
MQTLKVLIAEDEGIVARDIEQHLVEMGHEVVHVAFKAEEAIKHALVEKPDLILMDIMLQGNVDGIEAASTILEEFEVPVIYLTALSDSKTVKRALKTNPYGYIIKPFDQDDLRTAIELALFKYHQDQVAKGRDVWLRTLMRSMENAIIATDEKGTIKFVNEFAEELIERHECDIQENHLNQILMLGKLESENEIQHLLFPLEEIIEGGKSYTFGNNTILIGEDGTYLPVEAICTPLKDSEEEITGLVLNLQPSGDGQKWKSTRSTNPDELEAIGEASTAYPTISTSGLEITDILRMISQAPVASEYAMNWIQTFNGMSITLEGKRYNIASWRSKKAVDAFAFLLLKYPRPVHKEELMEFLWPEVNPATGTRRLHHVVSELRRNLEPRESSYSRKHFVQYDNQEYSLNLDEKVLIDFIIFEETAKTGNRLWVQGDENGALRCYRTALKWKRGEFLPKYRYDEQFEEKRARFEIVEEKIAERLGE